MMADGKWQMAKGGRLVVELVVWDVNLIEIVPKGELPPANTMMTVYVMRPGAVLWGNNAGRTDVVFERFGRN